MKPILHVHLHASSIFPDSCTNTDFHMSQQRLPALGVDRGLKHTQLCAATLETDECTHQLLLLNSLGYAY